MALIIGLGLAFAVAAFARSVGLDRDRAFYPTVLIVVGAFYVLFAAMVGSTSAMRVESFFFLAFASAAVVGFRSSLWLVAAGLAAHGLFDFTRHAFVPAIGAPSWWPAFCSGFDIAAGASLAALLWFDARKVRRAGETPG